MQHQIHNAGYLVISALVKGRARWSSSRPFWSSPWQAPREVLTMLSNLVSQIDAESTADDADYQAFLSWSRSIAFTGAV